MPNLYIKITILLGDICIRIETIEMCEIGHPKVVVGNCFIFNQNQMKSQYIIANNMKGILVFKVTKSIHYLQRYLHPKLGKKEHKIAQKWLNKMLPFIK